MHADTSGPGRFARPIWDRGEPIDEQMLAFTIGDDWLQDRRLLEVDIEGSLAHAAGLRRASLIEEADWAAIDAGLRELLEEVRAGAWTVEPCDEDAHSAVERRLVDKVGEAGLRLHTGRSRNDQVALDIRLWLRSAANELEGAAQSLVVALRARAEQHADCPLPGYTHLRRAMPSSLGDWAGAHATALEESLCGMGALAARLRRCPLGSGAGYGVPLPLDREGVAHELGFEGPEQPVTTTQLTRGRAELAYLNVLESLALDLGKLCADMWLFTSEEFGFASLPVELTTGSSMMPQKRNPDVLELARAHCRQLVAERSALLDVLRDLPSGYHRDFQLIKPPLFRAHDRAKACLSMMARVVEAVSFDEQALTQACSDPALRATERALEAARAGVPFRRAYAEESRAASAPASPAATPPA